MLVIHKIVLNVHVHFMFVKYYINVKFYHTSTNHIYFHGLHLLN